MSTSLAGNLARLAGMLDMVRYSLPQTTAGATLGAITCMVDGTLMRPDGTTVNMGGTTTVIDGLSSTSVTAALSANQGRVLQTEIASIQTQVSQILAGGGGGGGNGSTITIVNTVVTINEDTAASGNVLANDTTTTGTLTVTQYVVQGLTGIYAAGTPVTITGVGDFSLNASGAFTFTPVGNWNGSVPTVTYQCTNGTDIKNGLCNITVTPVNDAPNAANDTVGTLQGTPVTFQVLSNDTDIDSTVLTITQINGTAIAVNGTVTVSSGSVKLNSDKTLTYTPGGSYTGAQTFTYTIDDGSGGTSTATVTVNITASGSSTATPIICYTDCLGCPTGAKGESSQGGYLSIFGYNFGQPGDMGSLTKVYINGIEVNNYRTLGTSVVAFKNGMQRITVQVGQLLGLTVGTAYPITVVRNGTATSNGDITFIPSGGDVYFVSQVNGDDTTGLKNRIDKPYRHLQVANQTSGVTTGGVANVFGPGDQVVVRCENGATWTDATGVEGAWMRFTGGSYFKQGSAKAWIHFTAYPGVAGANAPEIVYYKSPGGAGTKGGFHGPNSSYWDQCGNWVAVSNMRIELPANMPTDGGFVYSQYAHYGWRVTNCELGPWPATGDARSGGFSGHPQGVGSGVYGCYIHDVSSGNGLNHGIYIDSGATDFIIAWNVIMNSTGGNMIQFFDQLGLRGQSQANEPANWLGYVRCAIHHNWCENTGVAGSNQAKYGLNLVGGIAQVDIYNNIIIGATYSGLRMDMSGPAAPFAINIMYNTFYNCDQIASGSGNGQVFNDGWDYMDTTGPAGHTGGITASGYINVVANIFAGGTKTLGGSAAVFSNNGNYPVLWDQIWVFHSNVVANGTNNQGWTGMADDPHCLALASGATLFTNAAAGDFSLNPASAAVDYVTGTPTGCFVPPNDYTGILARPQGTRPDAGFMEVANPKPYPISAPTFSGTAQVGSSSSVGTGTWGNPPITGYTYQWFTSTTLNGATTPIPGATGTSYTWAVADSGKYGGCIVTATNAAGSTATTVWLPGAIAASPNAPVNTTPPAITGTGGIGNLLTYATPGVWTPGSGANQPTITWVWRRNGVAISGTAGQTTYTQTSADDSMAIDVQETATNSFGSVNADSNDINVPHVPSAPVQVGTAQSFNSNAGANTVTFTANANDVIVLGMSLNNNHGYNLTITDTMGGSQSGGQWDDQKDGANGNVGGSVIVRKVPSAGSITVTIGTDGGATYAGVAILVRGVKASQLYDGVSVGANSTSATGTCTPSTTSSAKDFILEVISTADANWCVLSGYSDSFIASNNQTAIGRQVALQKRTTSAAGAQAAMTFAQAAGPSGDGRTTVIGIVNLQGF